MVYSLLSQQLAWDRSAFYFQTVDYFVIENVDNVRYFNNKYYCLASDVLVDRVIEFGKFIYGDEVSKMLNGSILV